MDQTQTGTDIIGRFERAVRAHGDKTALEYAGGSWSYDELDVASSALAAQLGTYTNSLERIAVIDCDRSPLVVIAALACVRARMVFLILGENQPDAYVARTLEAAKSVVWLGAQGRSDESKARRIAGSRLHAFYPLREAQLRAGPEAVGHTDARRAWRSDSNHAMYLVATSGTTGRPKVVQTSASSIVNFIEWYEKRFELSSQDRFSLLSGLGSDPLIRDMFTPLCLGACIEIPSREAFSARQALPLWLRERRVSVIHATPQLARSLFDTDASASVFESLRLVLIGGSILTARLATRITAQLPNGRLVNVYGTSETPQIMTHHLVTEADKAEAHESVPIGKPIAGVQIQVIDEGGTPLPELETGEIQIVTPFLSNGYYENAELTRERFGFCDEQRCATFRTGDLGFVDREGELHFIGRKDRQVKHRGYRVQLEEIERVLLDFETVAAAAVTHESEGDELVAYLQGKVGRQLDTGVIRRGIAEQLPAHALPTRYVVLESMPVSSGNKVDYAALKNAPRRRASAEVRVHEPAAAQMHVAGELRAIWAEVLGTSTAEITLERNFFDAGGTSLLSAKVVEHINRRLSQSLRVTDLFVYPNIRALSEYLGAATGTAARGTGVVPGVSRSERLNRLNVQLRKRVREEL